jgi:hypothetical protein
MSGVMKESPKLLLLLSDLIHIALIFIKTAALVVMSLGEEENSIAAVTHCNGN